LPPPSRFEGWKRAGKAGEGGCVGPTLLHPVKGDSCGRFSANGFGRGCWARQASGNGMGFEDVFQVSHSDPKTSSYYHALTGAELARVL